MPNGSWNDLFFQAFRDASGGGTALQVEPTTEGSSAVLGALNDRMVQSFVDAAGGGTAMRVPGAAPLASPTFTGTVTFPDGSTWTSGGINMASGKYIQAALGSAAAPSIIGKPSGTDGFYWLNDRMNTSMGGIAHWVFESSGLAAFTDNSIDIGQSGALRPKTGYFGTSLVTPLFEAKNSTTAAELDVYGSEITAGTRYSRLAIKHATTSVTAAVGATATATNLIPAKANVLGVNTVVTTGLGTSTGTTGYAVGDGTDPNRWGDVVGTAAGTDTDQTDATADPTGWFNAANNVVLTAAGGNFDGTGVILVDVAYTMTEAA